MLNFLQIDNYALIEHCEVEFFPGFNVITGESGAGKSILLGAVAFLTGARSSQSALRTGTARCSVSGIFSIPESLREPVHELLESAGISCDDENFEVTLRRVMTSSGSRQFINDTPVGTKTVTALGDMLIDRQKVNEQLSLQLPARQLELLDRYAGTLPLRRECAGCWENLNALVREQRTFQENLPDAAEADRLKLMVDEINAVNPEPGEDERLNERHRMASNARDIIAIAGELVNMFTDGEENLTDILGSACRKLDELNRMGCREAAELAAECGNIQDNIGQLSRAVSNLAEQVDLDPEELENIENRMGAIFTLKRRYGPSLEELFANRNRAMTELERFNSAAAAMAEFKRQEKVLRAELLEACRKLSRCRKNAVKDFMSKVEDKLHFLGFGKSRFESRFEDIDPGPNGMDRFELLFSANAGIEVQPLRKIASSGELSRVMLALKTVLADVDDVPTCIFDEIDMNIGGETANAVGDELKDLGKHRQIISISHLAQVAARADHHFCVVKESSGTSSISRVCILDDPAPEIARMLGNTEAAHQHAAKLIKELNRKNQKEQ